MDIKIIRHNDKIVWTAESGLPMPTEMATAPKQLPDYQAAAVTMIEVLQKASVLVAQGAGKVGPGSTKLERARHIFLIERDLGKSRKEIIARMVADLGMTEAGASTYHNMCKKASLN